MSLIDLLEASPDAIRSFNIQQITNLAGGGVLKDASSCSAELREYLSSCSLSRLSDAVQHCLLNPFDKSGYVLQDIINELGNRLDYAVVPGLYAGRRGEVGNDGLWRSPEGHSIVVEVKTTDAYRMSLDTLSRYRNSLIVSGEISGESSMLIVVGRDDTGELEAQIRGSRHAWDIRVISVEALVKLVGLKEASDEAETGRKIRGLLIPIEYTRIDALVDVVFTTVNDVQMDEDRGSAVSLQGDTKAEVSVGDRIPYSRHVKTDETKEKAISALSKSLDLSLIKNTRATFWTPDHRSRVVCTVSKRYDAGKDYWYVFHSAWRSFLSDADLGIFALACVGLDRIFAIPLDVVEPQLPKLNQTRKSDGSIYWHVNLNHGSGGEVMWSIPGEKDISLKEFEVEL